MFDFKDIIVYFNAINILGTVLSHQLMSDVQKNIKNTV